MFEILKMWKQYLEQGGGENYYGDLKPAEDKSFEGFMKWCKNEISD